MAARKRSDERPPPPVVRVAPLAELRAFTVSEHELDALARGPAGSLFLNFALFLLPISVTIVVTLLTTTIASDRLFQGFFSVAVITAIAGIILLCLWWREHRSSRSLVADIKSRMPLPPAIQETGTEQATGGDVSTLESV
jgi:hypothetical protein